MAYSKEARDRAEAQFHQTLKATKARKQAKSQYEAEERAVREKTARLKALRLAKEAAEKDAADKATAGSAQLKPKSARTRKIPA